VSRVTSVERWTEPSRVLAPRALLSGASTMHLITANVATNRVDEVRDGLLALGVPRLRFAQVSGYTEGCEAEVVWRGCRVRTPLVSECEVEALVCDESIDAVIEMIIKVVRSHARRDGFVGVTAIERCYRVGSGHPHM
jgi:nitrogen regulatory protein PII